MTDEYESWKAQMDRIDRKLRELEELDAAIFDLDREPVEYWDWPEHYGRA
jgi:hypothetical protein